VEIRSERIQRVDGKLFGGQNLDLEIISASAESVVDGSGSRSAPYRSDGGEVGAVE
jgi:hypothetical protein